MTDSDLSKLKIERGASAPPLRRRSRRLILAVAAVAVLVAGGLGWNAYSSRALEVEIATVATAYPSQAHSLLNATGCGVAQREAAVASKATGRAEWLGVEADVSESNLAKVKVGQPCEVQLDALPGMRFRGRVSRMVPTVDRSKATVLVKVQFVDKGLWGSSFSRYQPVLWKRFKYAEVSRRIAVTVGEPLPGATATPEGLRERVLVLRGERP